MDEEGNYIRRPHEILYEWTLDEVLDAHDVLDYVADEKARVQKQRQKTQPKKGR